MADFVFNIAKGRVAELYNRVDSNDPTNSVLVIAIIDANGDTDATMKDRDGADHVYKGVAIQDLLELAGVTTGKQLRGENLGKYLLVKCADGYEVVFSLAELDSSFTNRVVILADELGGKSLPAGKGPFRLVVPGEKKPARSSFQVVEFVVRFAKE